MTNKGTEKTLEPQKPIDTHAVNVESEKNMYDFYLSRNIKLICDSLQSIAISLQVIAKNQDRYSERT